MAKPPRDKTISESRTYFVTAKSWEGGAIFRAERIADLFVQTLFDYRAQRRYRLHEFVLMPDHFHALFTLGDAITLERAMQFISLSG